MKVTRKDLEKMLEQGILPYKFHNQWTVTFLSPVAEGICDASFDSLKEAIYFAKEILK